MHFVVRISITNSRNSKKLLSGTIQCDPIIKLTKTAGCYVAVHIIANKIKPQLVN